MAIQEADKIIRVSGSTAPDSLAAAISHALYENQKVSLRAIGSAAVNQAIKGAAIARGYVAQRGLDLFCTPGFTTISIDGQDRSAIVIRVFCQ